MAMNDRDVLGRDWDAMVRDMERSRRVEPRRMPWISAKQPYTKVEEAPDPDEMVLDLILGKGTGDWKKDLAFGLMGPAGGAATELSGGQSGVLDWLPGGGALKGMAVLAVPKLSNIVRSVTRSTGQDLGVDALRRAAQNAIDRLSRVTDHVVTPAEVEQAVADEVRAMGDMSDAPKLRMYATTIAKDVLERAQESLAQGRAPDFVVRSIPQYMDVGRKATEAANAAEKARLKVNGYNDRNRETLTNLSDEDVQRVENIARQRQQEHYLKLISEGRSEKDARTLAQEVYRKSKLYEAGKIRTATKKAAAGEKELREVGSTISSDANGEAAVREAGTTAYREAKSKALAEGLSEKEAIKVAKLARARAKNMKIGEIGGALRQARLDVNHAANGNVRKAFEMLSPDIQEEIEKQANIRREIARKQYLDNGATRGMASKKAAAAHDSEKFRLTREVLKELGFKNANDPRLAQYSQLSRDGNHVLATQPVQPAMAEAAAPVKGYVADVVEGAGKSMLDGIPDEEVEALLREYGETPTADRVFNREYLEELLREEGY